MGDSGTGNNLLLGELAYPALEGREGAVHLLPLGATEPHGPHAPLATDTLISVGICRRAAERLRGEVDVLVLPEVSYGVTRYGSDFPGGVSIGEETLRSLVTEIARQRRAARARQQPLRAGAGRDAARARPAAPRPHAARERRAAHRRVPIRLVPRGPVRDLARPRRSPRPGRPGAHGHAGSEHGQHAGGNPVREDRLPRDGHGSRRTAARRPSPPRRRAARRSRRWPRCSSS